MSKKKVFVSIPMRGRATEEIRKDMQAIFRAYCNPEEDELIDTLVKASPEETNVKRVGVWYLGRSIQMLSDANYIIFGPGYSKAPGCMVEGLVALLYHIPHTFISQTKINNKEEKNNV